MTSAATVDVVEAPSGFFVPDPSLVYSGTYWRGADQDWSWTHGAIAAGFTTASLLISAFDVDFEFGEFDEIFAMDDGVWVSLGLLAGASDVFAFTEFDLASNFFDDIAEGLNVRIDIDTGNSGWLVTLSKSVITTDGAAPPPPDPGVVPLPAAGWLMLAGLGGLAAVRRRKSV
ncbi:VPLPA-CTERM sorting domain-containing protein [Pseudotabrizicola formosa]|uniref:VPLPA-CTERM sorting domain-containing protein n=1 Tax=Pseudotabrizicola formosa TaxID=2030009 RepID=UPI001FF01A13|nr:VPLPA-CTERM sorting domain-containing protein [Pseudotabrizicola formosa]